MSLRPDRTAVGSSGKPASSPLDGDNKKMSAQVPQRQSALQSGEGRLDRWGDKIFSSLAVAAGGTIIAAIALMGLFLLIRAWPSLQANNANFITSSV